MRAGKRGKHTADGLEIPPLGWAGCQPPALPELCNNGVCHDVRVYFVYGALLAPASLYAMDAVMMSSLQPVRRRASLVLSRRIWWRKARSGRGLRVFSPPALLLTSGGPVSVQLSTLLSV
jgi:hypothetical protein